MFQVALNLLALRHLTWQMVSEMVPVLVLVPTELRPRYKAGESESASFMVFPALPHLSSRDACHTADVFGWASLSLRQSELV